MKPFLRLTLWSASLLFICSCQNKSASANLMATNQVVLANTLISPAKESIAIIYDYNPTRAKLESKAVKVNPSTGDKLKDALKAFFATNKLYGSYEHIQLKEIDNSKTPDTFIFSGKPGFNNEDDKVLFRMALEMTIARNYKSMEYDVKFEDF